MTGPGREPAAARRHQAARIAALPISAAVTPDDARTTPAGGPPMAPGGSGSPAGRPGRVARGGPIVRGSPMAEHWPGGGLTPGGGPVSSGRSSNNGLPAPGHAAPAHAAPAQVAPGHATPSGQAAQGVQGEIPGARASRAIRGIRRRPSLLPPGQCSAGAVRPAG